MWRGEEEGERECGGCGGLVSYHLILSLHSGNRRFKKDVLFSPESYPHLAYLAYGLPAVFKKGVIHLHRDEKPTTSDLPCSRHQLHVHV